MDDHGSGTSPRIVAIAPQAWSEAPIGLIKRTEPMELSQRLNSLEVTPGLRPQDLVDFGDLTTVKFVRERNQKSKVIWATR